MKINKNTLRHILASQKLIEAVSVMLKGAMLLRFNATEAKFRCLFSYSSEVSNEQLVQLEKRMNQTTVSVKHMLRRNAKEYLKSMGHRSTSDSLSSWSEGVISLVQVEDSFTVLEEQDFDEVLSEKIESKLFSLTQSSNQTFMIEGCSADSESACQGLIQKCQAEKKLGHLAYGDLHGFFEEVDGGVRFYSNGLELLKTVEEGICHSFGLDRSKKVRLEKEAPFFQTSELYITHEEKREAEDSSLFDLSINTAMTIHLQKDLDLLEKIQKAFSFSEVEVDTFSIQRHKPTSVFVKNFLSEQIEIAKVFFENKTDDSRVKLVIFSLEKCLALILEKNIDTQNQSSQHFLTQFLENSTLRCKKEYQENTHLG